jgi:hypothetical protein
MAKSFPMANSIILGAAQSFTLILKVEADAAMGDLRVLWVKSASHFLIDNLFARRLL